MPSDNHISYIGTRFAWGGEEFFGIQAEDRRRHLYTIGKTGTGKTTLLRNLIVQDIEAGRGVVQVEKSPAPTKPKKVEPPEDALAVVNAPMDFELKGLDQAHPYLRSRGFTPETIAHFGLGYCSRGSLKGRVAIPLQEPRFIFKCSDTVLNPFQEQHDFRKLGVLPLTDFL